MSLDVSRRSLHDAQDTTVGVADAVASTSYQRNAPSSTGDTQPVQEWDHPLSQGLALKDDGSGGVTPAANAEDGEVNIAPTLDGEAQSVNATAAQEAAATTAPSQIHVAVAADDRPPDRGENEAISVRRHMIGSAWDGFTLLTRFRRWIFVLRLLIALTQISVGIAIMALPSSLGNSFSTPETCDPEGMFVYLVLHCLRVACSIPVDAYLGLSPHRSPRARRRGAEGLMERERERRIGSLHLDRKMGRFGDLLGFCHVVLFIVGNYVVWTSVECSRTPADSRPLFFTCVAMLSITYLLIFEVALMVFLVVFFLPVLIAILSALGLSHRLPHRDIHPETGKVNQDDIEKHSKLVYYTPAEGEDGSPNAQSATAESAKAAAQPEENETSTKAQEATTTQDKSASGMQSDHPTDQAAASPTADAQSTTLNAQHAGDVPQQLPKRRRIGRLFGLSRRQASSASLKATQGKAGAAATASSSGEPAVPTKYPLHPIPAHRATCPICLCDYEEVPAVAAQAASADVATQEGQASSEGDSPPEPEPLRLLSCGHVMHKTCVDQWLTAVSGRCPVCQRPIMGESAATQGGTEA